MPLENIKLMFDTETMQSDLQHALDVLHKGGVILYPTDTIWGIGCDATNPKAVAKVYQIKQRTDQKAMLVLMNNANLLTHCVSKVPEMAQKLIETHPNPLTLIYPEARNLAKNLINSDGTIGIRITKEEFSFKLIEAFKKPIVSTSANLSGEMPPANFAEIDERIKDLVDYVVKYRQNDRKKTKASDIIKIGNKGEIQFLRKQS